MGCLKSYCILDVSPDKLSKDPFLKLTRPDSSDGPTGFIGLRTLAMVEGVLRSELGTNYRRKWKLEGYSTNRDSRASGAYQAVILVKRVSNPK
jgi:hypothetical protein